ncbi:MAG TPA: terminase TerL endonuclease subunit, partial [Dehalococcoidia bacterium]
VHMALIDELHEHPNAAVLDKMSAGTKGRRQGLIFEITNSGYDRHSVCWEHHEMSRKVLEGTIENDEWFAYVCGLDESDSWVDESCWVKANPNLGVSIPVRYLRKQVAEAVGMPSKANIVQRLNFCIWTQQITRWIPLTQWDAAPPMRASLHGAAFGGLDLATTTDLAAFVRVFPDEDGGYDVQARFWCPEEGITQRSRAGVPYEQWARDGWIDATPGNVTDYSAIRAAIKQDADTCDLREIGYDRWNASQLVGELEEDGATMVPIGQGFASMNAPSKELERLIASGQIRHGGNPVLRWMISNVAAATDPAGNIKPDKQRSSEKIDGVVALVMALSRAVANAGGTGTSKYDTEGLMVFGGAWDEDEE